MQSALARTLALSGKPDRAVEALRTLEHLAATRYVSPFEFMTHVHLPPGDRRRGLSLAGQGVRRSLLRDAGAEGGSAIRGAAATIRGLPPRRGASGSADRLRSWRCIDHFRASKYICLQPRLGPTTRADDRAWNRRRGPCRSPWSRPPRNRRSVRCTSGAFRSSFAGSSRASTWTFCPRKVLQLVVLVGHGECRGQVPRDRRVAIFDDHRGFADAPRVLVEAAAEHLAELRPREERRGAGMRGHESLAIVAHEAQQVGALLRRRDRSRARRRRRSRRSS